jgi:amidase
MDRRDFLTTTAATGLAAALPVVRPQTVVASELPADLTSMSASALSAAIRQRHVSCREVMRAYLARIDRYNPVYNAIVSLRDEDALLAEADAADRALDRGEYRGWMHGMPHAVKDLADARGLPTSQGSPIFAGQIADEDSPHIARIREAGAIFIGKTNTPEFGMGSQTYNPVFGATGSAYDPELTAGGSSGGAACGLATHMLPVADGGDMMGSLRNPGAFNNVIGFRPTMGRVPGNGAGDLFYLQLAVSGPMGRNSEDTARLLCTMAGATAHEPLSLRDELPTAAAFGALVEPCRPDYAMDRLWQTWLTLRHWRRHTMLPLYEDPDLRARLKPEAVWEIEGSFDTSSTRIFEAGLARADWFRALRSLFDDYDLLVLPTAQVFPFPKDIHWPDRINDKPMDTYHRWMEVVIGGSLGGLPVANVPVGFDPRGRPMGMQVMGPFGEDKAVLEFAMSYESVTAHLDVRPRLVERS